MKKNRKYLYTIVIIILAISISLFLYNIFNSQKKNLTPTQTNNLEKYCKDSGGTWLSNYKECEGADSMISETDCAKFKGQYFGCESPCRHNPKTEMCITLCMKVCKF